MAINSPLMRKTLSLLAYVAIAVAVSFLILDRHGPTLAVGTLAPIDEKLELISGSTTTFKRLLKKPMVVNFWASWCPPCLKELPAFSKVAKRYQGRVIFVGAAVDSAKADIMSAKKSFLLDYELATVSDEVANKWQGRALPTTYVLDTKGKVIWARAGISSEEQLESAIRLSLGK